VLAEPRQQVTDGQGHECGDDDRERDAADLAVGRL